MTHPNPKPIADLYAALKKLLPKTYAVIGAYAYGAVVEPREMRDIDVLRKRRDALAIAKKLAATVEGVTWEEHPSSCASPTTGSR